MNVIKEPHSQIRRLFPAILFLQSETIKRYYRLKEGYLRMIKRKFRVLITPVLLLGLAACNNDTDTAMDVQNRDQYSHQSKQC